MLGSDFDNPALSLSLAEKFSVTWLLSKEGKFANYILETYGILVKSNPTWEALIIAELRSANYLDLSFCIPLVRRYWSVDDFGLNQVKSVSVRSEVLNGFYRMPIIRFATDGNYLLVSEGYIPGQLLRRLHRITLTNGQIDIGNPVKLKVGS